MKFNSQNSYNFVFWEVASKHYPSSVILESLNILQGYLASVLFGHLPAPIEQHLGYGTEKSVFLGDMITSMIYYHISPIFG